ncbi:DUF3073 domain-containing protein [Sediminivirga luteola]|uniref:DUF3073 domain-containing protein n=1 Tax=Sediminivirga luteola TaxID=1774748 RepID=A0A8J2TXW8_9MICO|nr:DUF3073 domain-containing protein [Sediminivirga luteola]MCI2266062.1 DUF3073 domain-containing protein [Sediminivirga luteola]GGA13368.1 hypothetical protein GCM10011333_15400 [Sediminivirga luteola]
MGRGRAKAKQTKVARKLKYSTPETDLTALERELASRRGSGDGDDDYSDIAARYNSEYEDEGER